ncbi:phosphotransferase family protein [Nanoarchaeota archaeon]
MKLSQKNISQYLKKHKLAQGKPKIEKLTGGWLNPIFLVKASKPFVVKQVQDRGKKEFGFENYRFPRERMLNEYNALQICNDVSPGNAPKTSHVDYENYIFAMEYIQGEALDTYLREKKLSNTTARELVKMMLNLHNGTLRNNFAKAMVSHKNYWPLKYKVQYENAPFSKDAKKKIKEFIPEFKKRKYCVVHGDFNTKNILVTTSNGIAAVDWEEAGFSDPAHDVATILGHLIIFKHVFGTVSSWQIQYIFNKYIEGIGFDNKKDVKRSIVVHTACIILSRLKKPIDLKYIPKSMKPELKEIAEKAIMSNIKDIRCFL